VEEDRHGILYGNSINISKGISNGISNGWYRYIKVVFKYFIDGMCVAARAPAVITIRGSIFQPLAAILSISGLYLLALASSVSSENLSLQYVNSINCMVLRF